MGIEEEKKLRTILNLLDEESIVAQLELEKAMHASENLADYFDLRDENFSALQIQNAIVTGFKDAAIDSDITHDYMIQVSNHIKALRSAVEELFQLYKQQ